MPLIWRTRTRTYDLDATAPLVMGILNVTPDSFSDGGDHNAPEAAIAWAEGMKGLADIVDVGGESTRPGFGETAVTLEMELERVLPVVTELARRGVSVSVDTSKAGVMRAAAEAGAEILNDIRGFEQPGALETAAESGCGLVIMDRTQLDPEADAVDAVRRYLEGRTEAFLKAGVDASRICWDPGVGFGKTYEQNLDLWAAIECFADSGFPVMTAISRKSMIGLSTGIEKPKDRVDASVAGALLAASAGSHVLRVHDVRATADACAMLRVWRRTRARLGL